MNRKNLGIRSTSSKLPETKAQTHPTPSWVPMSVTGEKELCPDCFKVVGERSRYNLVCTLGKAKDGMTVGELTDIMNLKQPTITHHLQMLESVNAVQSKSEGRTRTYKLNRNAHCFEDCKIPY
jgi:DNA-binding transcriptional ArsR family regulator